MVAQSSPSSPGNAPDALIHQVQLLLVPKLPSLHRDLYNTQVLLPLHQAQEATKVACETRGGHLEALECVVPPPMPIVAPEPLYTAPETATMAPSAPVLPVSPSTSNSYAYGNCTWYVASKVAVPPFWGNANQWTYSARAAGYKVGSVPVVGSVAATSSGPFGHVALVVGVNSGTVTVTEMNATSGFGAVDTQTYPTSHFDYIAL